MPAITDKNEHNRHESSLFRELKTCERQEIKTSVIRWAVSDMLMKCLVGEIYGKL